MSCYLVSNDHVGYLVNLGQQLRVENVLVVGQWRSVALDDATDRRFVTQSLMMSNRDSVSSRYADPVEPFDVPTISNSSLPLSTQSQYVQALQWVRCYQYQSCDDSCWPQSFAYAYTERLAGDLEHKIISSFPGIKWSYNGPRCAS